MISLRLMIPASLPGLESFGPSMTTILWILRILIKLKMAESESRGEQVTTPWKSTGRCLRA